ncbi:hypothetical protein [Glutamicibacter protophormiae]|uniref:Uncharacterized protein n=1 Tax=Glutamicibacter protophormiae TaxID=37930 RepID=A0ABS4XVG8_GLUPR|nr:hypothetical protein [Glutamicibacter protophormiae]MBP2400509.1 hypothetical protein [Glutamicibacter protophormiae]GGM01039.1 hypothetical protein GCM10010038_33890 [Glutamicibacter protophormiae]
MTSEPEDTPTAESLTQVIRDYVQGSRYLPGVVRQLTNPKAYIETPAGRYPGNVLLEAVLKVVEGMQRAGVTGAEILRASNTEFQTAGPEAAELMPYIGGIVWLADEEYEYETMYNIGTESAIYEILLLASGTATDLDYGMNCEGDTPREETMTRHASEIYDDLKALANELEDLAETGRITMSTDSWNKDYPDTNQAVAQALAALQVAINATCWMETLPEADPTAM